MKKIQFVGMGILALGMASCSDGVNSSHAGVIITTNTSPAAKVYLYEQGQVLAVDSAQMQEGRVQFSNLNASKSYVVWLSQDSEHGALVDHIHAKDSLSLDAQPYMKLKLKDSKEQTWRGYLGVAQSIGGTVIVPFLAHSVDQLWQSDQTQVSMVLNAQNDTLKVQKPNGTETYLLNQVSVTSNLALSSSSLGVLSSLGSSSVSLSSSSMVLNSSAASASNFIDTRDNKLYSLVQIGTQTWMGENLRKTTTVDSYCPNLDNANCDLYGYLYTWATAQSICPPGFHLPDSTEFETLMKNCGGASASSNNLRSTTWNGGKDVCGFGALAAGQVTASLVSSNFGRAADFWVRGQTSTGAALDFFIVPAATAPVYYEVNKDDFRSVRCLKD